MKGSMRVSYKMLCENDFFKEVYIEEILSNEKVLKVIKNEFAKNVRNVSISQDDCKVVISTTKEIYKFEASKSDFADLIELAEEDAKSNKRIKKGCSGVEIVDFVTL